MNRVSAILFGPGKTLSYQKNTIKLNLSYYLTHMSTTIIFQDTVRFNMGIPFVLSTTLASVLLGLLILLASGSFG
jgi:hypothetical protein